MKHSSLGRSLRFLLFVSIMPLPVSAGTAVVLWRDITTGMTSAQLIALYPPVKGVVRHKKGFSIIEGVQKVGECSPGVNVSHYDGTVSSVIVQSREHGFLGGTCGNDAEKALLAKYGPPMSRDESSQKVNGLYRGGTIGRDVRQISMTWVEGKLQVTFKRDDPDQDDRWSISYEEAKDIGL